jgi:hypothetical protein
LEAHEDGPGFACARAEQAASFGGIQFESDRGHGAIDGFAGIDRPQRRGADGVAYSLKGCRDASATKGLRREKRLAAIAEEWHVGHIDFSFALERLKIGDLH